MKTITVEKHGKDRWLFTTSEGSRAVVERTTVRRQHSTLNGRNSWETRSRKYTTFSTWSDAWVAVAGGEFERLRGNGAIAGLPFHFESVRGAKAAVLRWLENN